MTDAPRSPIHTGRETTHTHTRVRGRLFSAFHCNINGNVMKLHSEIEFKLLQNNINDNFLVKQYLIGIYIFQQPDITYN